MKIGGCIFTPNWSFRPQFGCVIGPYAFGLALFPFRPFYWKKGTAAWEK